MFWSSSGHGAADPFLVGGTSEFTTWSFAPAGAPVDLGAKGWDLGSKRILKASFLLRFSVNLGDKILDFPCETDNQNLSNAVLMDILHCVLQGVDFFCALAKLKLPRVFKKKVFDIHHVFWNFWCQQNHVKQWRFNGLLVARCFRCIDTEALNNLEERVCCRWLVASPTVSWIMGCFLSIGI